MFARDDNKQKFSFAHIERASAQELKMMLRTSGLSAQERERIVYRLRQMGK